MLDLNFIGYVEGFDLFDDSVDVVVADGFIGNVVLKTAESLGYAMMQMLKRELTAIAASQVWRVALARRISRAEAPA